MDSFCTIFDSNYLSRGLTLYQSLADHAGPFKLWVLAGDDPCAKVLDKLQLPNLKVVRLSEFETADLLAVKPLRTGREYNWTCTPLFTRYCMNSDDSEAWTYVDPDVMFFDSPRLLLEEMAGASVLVTEHRFAPRFDQELGNGRYCVQFNTFKRTPVGLEALDWWCDRCVEWCYARHEDGRFGDQKYLDDWTVRFEGVHVARHPGSGLGPWNVEAYALSDRNGQVTVSREPYGTGPLVFYHFHALKFLTASRLNLAAGYPITPDAAELIYSPYVQALLKAAALVGPAVNAHGIQPVTTRVIASIIRQRFLGVHLFDTRTWPKRAS